jgi:hypothetical protein
MAKAGKKKSARLPKWNDCNLVELKDESSLAACLWHFAIRDRQLSQKARTLHGEDAPMPSMQVEQAWRQFFSKRLNLTWLANEHLYLRVLHLPACEDHDEIKQILEFQLEKISPVPVHQIVWSFELLPCPDPNQQTVLLALAESHAIESLLSKLDTLGYQTDWISFAALHGLADFKPQGDCIRVAWQPRNEASADCMISWHIQGWAREVGLIHIPSDQRGAKALIAHLNHTAWTGELEGWLQEAPKVIFEGPGEPPTPWQEATSQWTSHGIEQQTAPEPDQLSQRGAQRSILGQSSINLMPPSIHRGYRQRYIDGLWWSSLKGIGLVYLFGVGIYFAALEWKKTGNMDLQVALRSRANAYTNTMALQAKVNILQEQVDLKYSALDSLRVISELMPDGMSLISYNFRQGKILTLRGNVASDQTSRVTDYHEALIDAQVDGKALFESVSDPSITAGATSRRNPGASSTWSFNCELKRSGFE